MDLETLLVLNSVKQSRTVYPMAVQIAPDTSLPTEIFSTCAVRKMTDAILELKPQI
jgi:hypothetical protein